MKKALLWVGISLPWITGAALVVVFCGRDYLAGRNFAHGLHSFRWIGYTFVGVLGFLWTLLISVCLVIMNRDYLREPLRRRCVILVLATSLLVPLLGIMAVPKFFYAGRDAAYRSVDYEAVYNACKELAASIPEPGKMLFFGVGGPESRDLDQLPSVIRQLGPRFVHVETYAVAIQMDGGGVMYHEGIGVILAADSRESERCLAHCSSTLEYSQRLHASLPVVLYRLYDYGILLDEVRKSLNDKQQLPAESSPASTP